MEIVSKFVDKQQEIDSIKTLHWLSQSWVNYGLIGFFIFLEQLFSSELSRNCFWSLIFQLNYLQIIFLVYWIIKPFNLTLTCLQDAHPAIFFFVTLY